MNNRSRGRRGGIGRRKLSDWLLVTIASLGLAFSFMLPAIFITPFIRNKVLRLKWQPGYILLLFSVVWALLIIPFRDVRGAGGLLFQYAFIWTVPFIALLYRPTDETLQKLKILVALLFILDLSFNLYVAATGSDLLGRTLDSRPGLLGMSGSGFFGTRGGGLFGHSFYSGTISFLAYVFAVASPRFRWLAILGALNLLLAGSWRLGIPLVLVPYFFWHWDRRSRIFELVQVILISTLSVFLIVATSSQNIFGLGENDANGLRVFAWLNAFSEISNSPWFGVGYPSTSGLESINIDVIKESLIAESWYLNSAITFGIPYVAARFLGILLILYGPRFKRRSLTEALFVPIVLVDLVYGGMFEGTLFYIIFWFILAQERSDLPKNNVDCRFHNSRI